MRKIDWPVLGYLVGAGVALTAAVVSGVSSDWQNASAHGLITLCFLVIASKTAHQHMLTEALRKSVFAHEQHKEHTECSRHEPCSDEEEAR